MVIVNRLIKQCSLTFDVPIPLSTSQQFPTYATGQQSTSESVWSSLYNQMDSICLVLTLQPNGSAVSFSVYESSIYPLSPSQCIDCQFVDCLCLNISLLSN